MKKILVTLAIAGMAAGFASLGAEAIPLPPGACQQQQLPTSPPPTKTNAGGQLLPKSTSPTKKTAGGNWQLNGTKTKKAKSDYRSAYDIVLTFLEAFFVLLLAVIILKVFSILDRAKEVLEKEFAKEDAKVIQVVNSRRNQLEGELKRALQREMKLNQLKERAENKFRQIEAKIEEFESFTRERASSQNEGIFEALGNLLSWRSRRLKAEMESLLKDLKNLKSPWGNLVDERDVELLVSNAKDLNPQSVEMLKRRLSALKSSALNRLNGELGETNRQIRTLEGAFNDVNEKVVFDLNVATRAAAKKALLEGIETALTVNYYPFIKLILDSKPFKAFLGLFLVLNAFSLVPLVKGFMVSTSLSGSSVAFWSLAISLVVSGVFLFIEYLLLPLLFYGQVLQLLGFAKISFHQFNRLPFLQRIRYGWQIYALKLVLLLGCLTLVYTIFLYVKAVYTLTSLRLGVWF